MGAPFPFFPNRQGVAILQPTGKGLSEAQASIEQPVGESAEGPLTPIFPYATVIAWCSPYRVVVAAASNRVSDRVSGTSLNRSH
jgi:hypothetical protein